MWWGANDKEPIVHQYPRINFRRLDSRRIKVPRPSIVAGAQIAGVDKGAFVDGGGAIGRGTRTQGRMSLRFLAKREVMSLLTHL